MNSKDCKKISRQTDLILVEWLKTLVSDEEKEQINTSNIHSLLPSANYFYGQDSAPEFLHAQVGTSEYQEAFQAWQRDREYHYV